ncbi:putative sporulation protein YtxC [Bacillus timonensis]|nr:putative sporulation protein YtxC [Bacillus timonensis]
MIEIHFQESLDAVKVYGRICAKLKAYHINYIDILYDQAKTITVVNVNHHAIQTIIIPVIAKYIIYTKEDEWILSMIENQYYYTDYEEKNQILSIVHSIMEGEIKNIPEAKEFSSREKVIEESLKGFIVQPISFSFESFLKFRMKQYTDRLLQYVELAIDEYKLEQEYQNFVHTLRDYTMSRQSTFDHIHLLHEDQFYFYNDTFQPFKREEILKYVDRKLVVNQPMYIDSAVLAPLVSIAPKYIHVYTNEVDNGMIQTIQNIFLERVKVYSKQQFQQIHVQTKI